MIVAALVICIGIVAWAAWQIRRCPRVDERRCPIPIMLDRNGRCPGPCTSHPPCLDKDRPHAAG